MARLPGVGQRTFHRYIDRYKDEGLAGMTIRQDGSSQERVTGENRDLIVTMDDTTREVYSGFLVEEEDTWSSFQGVCEPLKKRANPAAPFCTPSTSCRTSAVMLSSPASFPAAEHTHPASKATLCPVCPDY